MNLPKELKFEQLTVEQKYYRAVPDYMKRRAVFMKLSRKDSVRMVLF